ncbi:MAG TPA: hypothetical protein VG755_42850 [Nannocystaceae bacterium]|nr:hypothetical protein [Nannocystaceae bacterium]
MTRWIASLLACACTPVPWIEPMVEEQIVEDLDEVKPPPEAEPPLRSVREVLDLPPPRQHALWPVPVTAACPRVAFGSLTPAFTSGDMMRRVAADFSAKHQGHWSAVPSEVMLLRDHLGRAGVRLVAAMDHSAGCMMGWWSKHCFVTATQVYCPGDARETIARFVRDLAIAPRDLEASAWLEVVTVLLDVETIVLWPAELSSCTQVTGAVASAPSVRRLDDRVVVQLTAIVDGAGISYTVDIRADHSVVIDEQRLWEAPPER